MGDIQECSEEQLNNAQKKERKELQAKIQSMKHGIPKGDKKKRRETNEQVSKLEAELDDKHEKEWIEFKNRVQTNETDKVQEITTEISKLNNESSGDPEARKSKAQRRKDRKESKRLEKLQTEPEDSSDARQRESDLLQGILMKRGLKVFDVPSDGHCMYKALEHQLQLQGIEASVPSLRKQTADYIRNNIWDFLPFLTNSETGNEMTTDEFQDYCDKIEKTAAWGGQIELQALTSILQMPIEVIQAESAPVLLGTNYHGPPLLLSYHHHIYGLGEHYNSVVSVEVNIEDAEWGEAS